MDVFSRRERSEIMRRVKSRNTRPELKVRTLLHHLGYRFRLQRTDLPGSPDLVLPKYRTALFVHGCFWHRHPGCPRATMPSASKDYWIKKFTRNTARDVKVQQALRRAGWRVVVVWECELRDQELLTRRLLNILSSQPS